MEHLQRNLIQYSHELRSAEKGRVLFSLFPNFIGNLNVLVHNLVKLYKPMDNKESDIRLKMCFSTIPIIDRQMTNQLFNTIVINL